MVLWVYLKKVGVYFMFRYVNEGVVFCVCILFFKFLVFILKSVFLEKCFLVRIKFVVAFNKEYCFGFVYWVVLLWCRWFDNMDYILIRKNKNKLVELIVCCL